MQVTINLNHCGIHLPGGITGWFCEGETPDGFKVYVAVATVMVSGKEPKEVDKLAGLMPNITHVHGEIRKPLGTDWYRLQNLTQPCPPSEEDREPDGRGSNGNG